MFFAGVGFGDSGLVSELSIQLDFVGLLKRFDGLPGEVSVSSIALWLDAVDLLLPCDGSAGLTKPSLSCPVTSLVRSLLELVGLA